jgi:hypothetical protein
VGGKREALIPTGADRTTTDEKLAQGLIAVRLADLEGRRRKQRGEPEEEATLAKYAARHRVMKARSGRFTEQRLEATQMHLVAAVELFCNGGRVDERHPETGRPSFAGIDDRDLDRDLGTIDVADVHEYVAWLASRPNRPGGTLSTEATR